MFLKDYYEFFFLFKSPLGFQKFLRKDSVGKTKAESEGTEAKISKVWICTGIRPVYTQKYL